MARPIKETPVLHGSDAERFYQRMENLQPATAEQRQHAMQVFQAVAANTRF